MTMTANLADGRVLNFPDGTDPAVIQQTVKRMLSESPQATQEAPLPQPAPEQGFSAQLVGGLENIGALASGIVAEPLAGIAGLAQSINPFAEEGAGAEAVKATREALTFTPGTQAGKSQQQAIGETLAPIGEALSGAEEFLGESTLDLTGSPLLATAAHSLPTIAAELLGLKGASKLKLAKSKSPLAKKIAEESTGNTQKSFSKKLIEDQFTQSTFKKVKEARKQGFDDGMTTVIANSSPTDRRRMLQMIDKLEKGKADSLFQAKNRPADVAGDSLLRKVDFVKSNNSLAGKQLGRIAEGLKGKDVDISNPVTGFFDGADSLGVKFDDAGKPNFAGSQIEGVAPAESLINKISLRIKRMDNPDALDAHNFKKFIDENVSFGKVAEGLGGKTERLAKKLRAGVNSEISGKFVKYKEANARFSDTIQALDSLQDAAGKKLDFFGPNAEKATGTVLRRLMSNAQGRVTLMDAIENIETTAKKYGGDFDDDIMTQMLFADELDTVFGGGARTSLRGEVKKANVDAAIDLSQLSIPGALAVGAKAGTKKLRGINEKNQLKSIKDLLRGGK